MRDWMTVWLCLLALWAPPSWAQDAGGAPTEAPAAQEVPPLPPDLAPAPSLARRYRAGRTLSQIGVGTWIVGEATLLVGIVLGVRAVAGAFGDDASRLSAQANRTIVAAQVLCLVGPAVLVVGDRVAWKVARDDGRQVSFVAGWISAGVVGATWAFNALVLTGEGYLLGPAIFAIASGTLGSVQAMVTHGAVRGGRSQARLRWIPAVVPTLVGPRTPGLALAWRGR